MSRSVAVLAVLGHVEVPRENHDTLEEEPRPYFHRKVIRNPAIIRAIPIPRFQ